MVAQDPSGQVCAWCERQRFVLLGIRTWGPNAGAMSAMAVHGRARTKLSRAIDALESQRLRGICLCGSPVSSTRCRHAETSGCVHYAVQVQLRVNCSAIMVVCRDSLHPTTKSERNKKVPTNVNSPQCMVAYNSFVMLARLNHDRNHDCNGNVSELKK